MKQAAPTTSYLSRPERDIQLRLSGVLCPERRRLILDAEDEARERSREFLARLSHAEVAEQVVHARANKVVHINTARR